MTNTGSILAALPFWLSLTLIPVILTAAFLGGWWLAVIPVYTWGLFSLLDGLLGANEQNQDPNTPRENLTAYHLVTLLWPPLQFLLLFGLLYLAPRSEMSTPELIGLFFGVGIATGTIGINYAHELMHQRHRLDRWFADLLLAMVLYSHFRSEHLLVHHRYVGTPRDAVTARYNEGFHRFFARVLTTCPRSAFQAEAAMLARKDLPATHLSNPFWKYAALQLSMLVFAFLLAGPLGVGLFLIQAFTAIWQLELVNYIEHYGLTRRHLGEGKYEHVGPHHSWNAAHKASNWLLINLQRHSDHHYKPDRPYPLLQTYDADTAPQLSYGYPVMTVLAMVPPAWRRVMNPKVRDWRQRYYADIEDWTAYKTASNPMPR